MEKEISTIERAGIPVCSPVRCANVLRLAGQRRMWNFEAVMKTASLFCLLVIAPFLFTSNSSAQSARQLTRKIVPPPTNSPPSKSARPPSSVRPAPPPPTTPSTAIPAPPRPVDPEKAKKEKEEVLKKTVEFQKKRAAEGSPSAQYDLGLRYLTGDGVEKNEELARKWLEASAKNDYALARRKLEDLDRKKTR